ncbi:PREDICTED: uncharacterized protein LOC108567013 isoform X2 [Nicrophorus vespilloides]|nr:PREDICTED: uncharacterized protein LOC108567013 isoform X2 [Nicrophorus vespilloides]
MLKFLLGNSNPKLPIKLLLIIIVALLVPIWLLTITILRLYRNSLGLLLYFKHGDKFITFMHGIDRLFSLFPKTDQGSTNIIFLLNFEGSGDEFYKITSEFLFNQFKEPKFNCLRKKFLGYYYYMKNSSAKEDVIKEIPIKVDDIMDYMEFLEHLPLPYDDESMLLYHIGKERVKNTQGKWCYPILIKMHHSLGDGLSLLRHLNNLSTNKFNYIKNMSMQQKSTVGRVSEFWRCIKSSQFDNCRFLTNPDNVFTTKHNGQKHYVLWTEDKPDVLDKMKQIQKLLPGGTTTMAIMNTALSKAFEEYYVSKSLRKPDFLNLTYTILPQISNSKFSEYTNSFGTSDMKLPVNFSGNLLDRLKCTIIENHRQPTLMNHKFNEWCSKVLYSIFPNSLVKIFIMRMYNSVLLSNLPGSEEELDFDYMSLEDYHYWVTNVCEAGIGIATYSYARRLNVSFKVDKGVIPESVDAHRLCNSMMENIYKLYDECLKEYK